MIPVVLVFYFNQQMMLFPRWDLENNRRFLPLLKFMNRCLNTPQSRGNVYLWPSVVLLLPHSNITSLFFYSPSPSSTSSLSVADAHSSLPPQEVTQLCGSTPGQEMLWMDQVTHFASQHEDIDSAASHSLSHFPSAVRSVCKCTWGRGKMQWNEEREAMRGRQREESEG